jgi:hypothetical protein
VQVNADAQEAGKQSFGVPVRVVPDCWDVVGLGQAMVSLFSLRCRHVEVMGRSLCGVGSFHANVLQSDLRSESF